MNRQEIIDYLKRKKSEYRERFGIEQIVLFGSFAKDRATPQSDVDIAIETPQCDYFLLFDMKEELERVFKRHVDLVRIRKKMNEKLKRKILEEGICV
ncbi:type VII toxin-antitoxin system MntA family adenylyltransferase antitoxin [Hydrogenimonas sp.]